LAGQGTLPDERIQFLLLRIGTGLQFAKISGADGFVGLLGALALGFELSDLVVVVAIFLLDVLFGGFDGKAA
jgi:hypothetical protein